MESDNELVARLNRVKDRISDYDDRLRSVIKQIATIKQYIGKPATVNDDQSALLEYVKERREELSAVKQHVSYTEAKSLAEALLTSIEEDRNKIRLIEGRYDSLPDLQRAIQAATDVAETLIKNIASILEPLQNWEDIKDQPQKTTDDFKNAAESQKAVKESHKGLVLELKTVIEKVQEGLDAIRPQDPGSDDDGDDEDSDEVKDKKTLSDFQTNLRMRTDALDALELPNEIGQPVPFKIDRTVDALRPLIEVMDILGSVESGQKGHKAVIVETYDGIKEDLDMGKKRRDEIEDELDQAEKVQDKYEEGVKGSLNDIQKHLKMALEQQEKGSKARGQTKKTIQRLTDFLKGSRMKKSGRTLILCFDGTGNKFGTNSNVVRLFDALMKDEPEFQLCYYMPGIGTYNKRQFIFSATAALSLKIDSAIARGLNDRVKEGYTFLMQNYRKGDKICLFGFSRGAYTARALSGMVYKVGLLPPHNLQQVDFAFTMYNSSDKEGARLARKFKQTFATNVPIDFLGVWDTVSSVGIIPKTLPHSTYNDGVKVFRHALALDEKRARFRPSVWGEPAGAKEELDEEPRVTPRDPTEHPDDWVYDPPPVPDVKEVWFAGCHADVGGGSHRDEVIQSLSNITLRWMIKECYQQRENGLLITFKNNILRSFGLDPVELEKDPDLVKIRGGIQAPDPNSLKNPDPNVAQPSATDLTLKILRMWVSDQADVTNGDVYDQLILAWAWWILEFLPMMYTQQQPDGTWLRQRRRNMGRGRYIPHADHRVHVHISVKDRIDDLNYKPKALNWSDIFDNKLIEWES